MEKRQYPFGQIRPWAIPGLNEADRCQAILLEVFDGTAVILVTLTTPGSRGSCWTDTCPVEEWLA